MGPKLSEGSIVPGSGKTGILTLAIPAEVSSPTEQQSNRVSGERVQNAEILFLQSSSGPLKHSQHTPELRSPAFGWQDLDDLTGGAQVQQLLQVEQETQSENPESSAYHSEVDYENFFNTSANDSLVHRSALANSRLPDVGDSQLQKSLHIEPIQCLPLQSQQKVVHHAKNKLQFSDGSFA